MEEPARSGISITQSLENRSTLGRIARYASSMLATEVEAAILKRVIHSGDGDLPPDVAKEMLKLGFSESDHQRMAALSEKAGEGRLTPSERDEFEGYVNVGHFLAFIQSRARLSLKSAKRDEE